MSAAVSWGTPHAFRAVTITGSGFSASTDYVLTISDPGGGTTRPGVKSDGSGAFTYSYTPQAEGSLTVDVRPKSEHNGTTTAAATSTATAGHGEVR